MHTSTVNSDKIRQAIPVYICKPDALVDGSRKPSLGSGECRRLDLFRGKTISRIQLPMHSSTIDPDKIGQAISINIR